MIDSARNAAPMSLKEKSHASDDTHYRSITGALQYLTFTRPDITHAVNKICQFFNNPTMFHLKAIKRILRYLKGPQDYGLRFVSQSLLSHCGFFYADWAGCSIIRRSTTGFVFSQGLIVFLGVPKGNLQLLVPVRKQSIVLWLLE